MQRPLWQLSLLAIKQGFWTNIFSTEPLSLSLLPVSSHLWLLKSSQTIGYGERRDYFTPAALGSFAQEKILVPIANPDNIGYLVDLALLIKDPKSPNPISLLGVVPNNVEAEKNIIKFRQKLQESVKDASAAEMHVDIITTIDYNIPNGIVRTARETMADIVIMGWPGEKTGFIEKLLGDKVDATIRNLDKNLFICHLEKPLISNNRIVVISPHWQKENMGSVYGCKNGKTGAGTFHSHRSSWTSRYTKIIAEQKT